VLLAINTSTVQFSLALLKEEGSVLAEYFMSEGRGHFGSLMPALDFLLETSSTEIRDLTALVVARGPGSFTGLRVGLAAAKGLGHCLRIPMIGIASLEALASQWPYQDLPVAPVLDSRRGELFTATFTWTERQEMIRITEDKSIKLIDFPSYFVEPTLFIGNNFETQASQLREILGPRALLAPSYLWNLRASAVGALGLRRFLTRDFDDPHTLDPIYLRPPDIRPNPFAPKPSTPS